jgi:hypothetical protein
MLISPSANAGALTHASIKVMPAVIFLKEQEVMIMRVLPD